MKAPSPLLGFNNNVRHKGRMFHIQTEDSGIRHPHIITHLFADGGRILKTTKTSYAEHVGTPTMAETVREMMKEQHKAMFIALREGHFNYLFDDSAPKPDEAPKADPQPAAAPARPAPPAAPPAPTPGASAGSPPPAAFSSSSARLEAPPAAAAPAARTPPSPAPAGVTPPPAAPRPPLQGAAADVSRGAPAGVTVENVPPSRRTSSRPRIELDAAALHNLGPRPSSGGPGSTRTPAVSPHSTATPAASAPSGRLGRGNAPEEPGIDLDLDILERAASEAQTGFQQQIQDLPPPPASVIGRRPGSSAGTYSAITPPEPPAPPPSVDAPRGGAGRYAPPRPASIFATTRPSEGASIFGEDLISEKSLDEVILSYLAEDLDGSSEKK
ncbi:hypothetical protein [Chondromyces crocatus]|uniref:Uncharacterized protein n=1 Tax=Chondromyces crocatus TaxID=52 RepID=A0A0K1EQ81_CHOCO|nr:hypothetical protein [Chondromyces crocatus]AKT42812.1 uncharacterized protein CMC5_070390 [Chondromyces crocatus]